MAPALSRHSSSAILRRDILAALGALLLLIGTTGCQRGRSSPVEAGNRDGVLHVGNGTEPPGLDPHVLSGIPEYRIVSALYESLTVLDPVTLEPGPGQAESWTVSPDGLKVTFRLREGLVWSNGDPLTAHDFVWSTLRAADPDLGCPYDELFPVIAGAAEYKAGTLKDPGAVGVRAIDDRTIEYTLAYPDPTFLASFIQFPRFPVHRASVEEAGPADGRGTGWDRPGRIVTNGPFVLDRWEPNQIIVLKRNPRYRDAASVKLREIHYHPIESAEAEDRAFEAGQIHASLSVPVGKVPILRERRDPTLQVHPQVATYFIVLNTSRPPFDDVRVRRALSLSIARGEITDFVLRGGQLPAYSFVPPATGYSPDPKALLREDIAEARRLLAEAGYPEGRGFPTTTYIFNTLESHRRIGEALQQMWKTNLGIEVQLENMEWKTFLDRRVNGDFSIARSGWVGAILNPSSFTDLLVSTNGNNHTRWASAAFDRLSSEAKRTLDPERREALFREAEALVLADMPVIPLYFYTSIYRLQPSVRGWTPSPDDHIFWRAISLEP